MDATQRIDDPVLETDEEENEEESENRRGQPLAKLCILKNQHIPEAELLLFLGDNELGRDLSTCTLDLPAPSVSKQHATICISAYPRKGRHGEVDIEALVWDLGSLNGTRKGRLKLTPNVRYALSEGDSLVVGDIPCRYVSCSVHTASSQGDMKTPGSETSGVKARLPDASGESEANTSTGSKKCVNVSPSLPLTTPVRAAWLSLEQTPNQPQDTLVPESDSDSDSERGRQGNRKPKLLVSDLDSHNSSPSCSTFLTPASKVVPESEDESPITPTPSTKNRPHRHVSFTTEERDEKVGQQEANKEAVRKLEDEEEEGGRGGQRGTRTPVKQEGSVSPTQVVELSVSKSVVVPGLNMDSDTDMEGEDEEVMRAGVICRQPVALQTNRQADRPPDTVQFHIDSDTDDEGEGGPVQAAEIRPSPRESSRPSQVISIIQPEGVTGDSDTDVDEDAATNAKSSSFQSARSEDSAASVPLKEFNLNSDTDVEEEQEEERDREAKNKNSKTDEKAPNKLDIKLIGPDSSSAGHSLHQNSHTDDEAVPGPAVTKPSATTAVTESIAATDAGAGLDILSDSDTDVEDTSPLVIPLVIQTLSQSTKAPQSESDTDTSVDESSGPPAGDVADGEGVNDTDVEGEGVHAVQAGLDQIPSLQREETYEIPSPPQQNFSTPILVPDEVEEMETQAFISPSSGTFRSPAVRPVVLSPCTDSPDDEDLVSAETQPFVPHNQDCKKSVNSSQAFKLEFSVDKRENQSSRGESFQLGLSDSSRLQSHDQALALESTQTFVFVESGVRVDEAQTIAAVSAAENKSLSEATQSYGAEEELARCSSVSEKEGWTDLALEETQLYISAGCNHSESSEDEEEGQNVAAAQTLPFDGAICSSLAMAETQLIEDGLFDCAVDQVRPRGANKSEEQEDNKKGEHHLSEGLDKAEMQPIHGNDTEDQTQPMSLLAETQLLPLDVDESNSAEFITKPLERKVEQLHLEEEETQVLTVLQLSNAQTQPMSPSEEDDDMQPISPSRKRKAKPLQYEEDTQSQTNSLTVAVESEVSAARESQESEDFFPVPRKRKAKQLQIEDEQSQTLMDSEMSVTETQPLLTGGDEKRDDVDSSRGPRKRKAKQLHLEEEETQTLTNTEIPEVEAQPLNTRTNVRIQEGSEKQNVAENSEDNCVNERGKNTNSAEDELLKRQRRGQRRTLSRTTAKEEKLRADSDKEDKEEVGQTPRGRRTSTRLQKENEKNEKELRKEQEETKLREKKLENERKAKEKQDRLQARIAERTRREVEKQEKEKKQKEEERLKCEVVERKEKEREENERFQQEEERKRELAERVEKEQKEQEQQVKQEEEAKKREKLENEKEKEAKENVLEELQENKKVEQKDEPEAPVRGRRGGGRAVASRSSTQPKELVSTNDDVTARRTRARSNSSNSVSSEASSSSTQAKAAPKRSSPAVQGKERKTVERKARSRTSAVPKKEKEEPKESRVSASSLDQDPPELPQTPSGRASRKRPALADSSPRPKSPRCTSGSPATGGRLRASSQIYRVLFTGVMDEDGMKVLARFGGIMAKDVADMNCLVTDKVRRTVKFLCAVAKGVPVVTTEWLEKCGQSRSLLSPDAFMVKDPEQEGKFNFCLQESLSAACIQPLLQGYKIHVTKSVKPEPVHMRDIIFSCGATFLPRMPSTHKPQTVVISCEDDWSLCHPALSASLPVVTAEFLLTGVLQQKIDFQMHKLSPPAAGPPPAGGRGRSRKKS